MAKVNWDEIQLLAAKAQEGNKVAYGSMLSLLLKMLNPRFRRALPDSHVEDALQETLIAIHKSLHTLDTKKPMGPWVNAIARYKVQDQLRKIYKHSVDGELIEEELSIESSGDIDTELYLNKLIQKLPDRDQKILQLLKVEGRSILEVASEMKMSPSNVKVVSFRALGKLRNQITEEEFHGNR